MCVRHAIVDAQRRKLSCDNRTFLITLRDRMICESGYEKKKKSRIRFFEKISRNYTRSVLILAFSGTTWKINGISFYFSIFPRSIN